MNTPLALPSHEQTARTKATIVARLFQRQAEYLLMDGCEFGPEMLVRLAPSITDSPPYGDVLLALAEAFEREATHRRYLDKLFAEHKR